MPVKAILRALILVLSIGWLTHLATVWVLPRLIMGKLLQKTLQEQATQGATSPKIGGLSNPERPTASGSGGARIELQPLLPAIADASFRRIVMPNPDLLYAACVLDLAEGPAVVMANPRLTGYWSLALYASNTDNFFVLNDHDAGMRPVKLLVQIDPNPKLGKTLAPEAKTEIGTANPSAPKPAAELRIKAAPLDDDSALNLTVHAPSTQVLLLMRVLVEDRLQGLAQLEAARRSLRCMTS